LKERFHEKPRGGFKSDFKVAFSGFAKVAFLMG
jgi:hypothetical protein